jgi:hypothetical protein
MKHFSKFIFFIIVVFSLILGSSLINNKNYSQSLKVGVNLDNLMLPINPVQNPNLTNAFFSNNLYSNLIDIDENNNYKNELVSKYWFDVYNKKLYFEFKKSRVNANDAEFSLRRFMVQNKQMHTNFRKVICEKNENLFECIKHIYVEDDKLVINYHDEDKAKYIIPALASVDYKIIPLEAFDNKNYEKSQIINYKITSGYYYLEKKQSKYFFIRNQNVRDDIYREYELVNVNADTFLKSDNDNLLNDIDIITTTVPMQKSIYNKLIEKKWSFYTTHNISIHLLVFSKNGIAKTNATERFSLARRLVEESENLVQLANAKKTIEFFQDFGQGFLTPDQTKEIEILRNKNAFILSKKISYGTKFPEKWNRFMLNNADFEIVNNKQFQLNMNIEDQPDMFIVSNDVSFDLSLSLISFAANVGFLDMNEAEIDKFVELKDESEKRAYINVKHFETLKKCIVYPMLSTPYHTAFNGTYEHSLSKFNSRTLLWKIH